MKGKVTTVFGPDINTDDIIRADILQEEWAKDAFGQYAFDKFDPEFRQRCQGQENAIIAGSNFGAGSSREQAVYAITFNSVSFVIAQIDSATGVAYPDIFYRNAINNGFPLLSLEDVSVFGSGDDLELDLENFLVRNKTKSTEHKFEMSAEDQGLLLAGGIIGIAKKDLAERLS